MPPSSRIDVYIERGAKRTFACAVDWPGWCRSGRWRPSHIVRRSAWHWLDHAWEIEDRAT